MRRLSVLLAAVLLLTGCSGLPRPREMGDMALLRTMGVDKRENGLAVTVSTGPRAKGIQAEGQPALMLSAVGKSLSAACLSMQGLSDSYVFFGYVDQLLVGEELARDGVIPVLDYFARDRELGLGAQLWVVREASAEDAVRAGGDQGVDSRLSTLQTDGKMGVAALPRTAGEVYADLLEWGSAYLPALVLAQGEDTALAERGYAILKGEALAGFLDGEAAQGLELLAGRPEQDILDVELGGQLVSVRVTGADTRSKLEFEGDALTGMTVTCRVDAQLAEYRIPLSDTERERLISVLEARECARMEAALKQLQGWQADCLGLGHRAALSSPGKWQTVKADWPRHFEALDVTVRVNMTLQEGN